MQQKQAPVAPKRNAAQRLDDLEAGMSQFFNAFNNLAAETMTIKEAIKLLGNKTESIVQVIGEGKPVNDDTISAQMVENNVTTLKEAVTKMISDKILVEQDAISMTSFVVGQEINDEGKVIQPRTQFALAAIPNELQQKCLGAKPGDVLELQPGKLKLSVQEVYNICMPEQPKQEA
jgi:hypothetical protein